MLIYMGRIWKTSVLHGITSFHYLPFLSFVADVVDEVHVLNEAEYFISRVGNVTEEKSCVNVFEFSSGIGILKI